VIGPVQVKEKGGRVMSSKMMDKIRAGKVSFGIWVEWFEPDLIEVCGYVGFDYAVIDGEHTPLDHRLASEMIRACNVVGMVPIVRIPEINRSTILRYLELGAVGIYVPHVNTAEEARTVVDAVKYAPVGHRGAGSMRAVQFGLTRPLAEMYRAANEETLTILLIEEVAGVRNLDEIMSVDGVDVLAIGSGDLSHSMGLPGEKTHPDVRKAVVDAEAKISGAGRVFESTVSTKADAQDAIDRGSLMVSLSIRPMVAQASRQFIADLKLP
jgi:4-hydroxy-2-oxoheptanedioate aldolase